MVLRSAFAALAALLVANAVFAILDPDAEAAHEVMLHLVPSGVYVLSAALVVERARRDARERIGWSLLAIGLCLYAAGNVVWVTWLEDLPSPPIPSISDVLWLSLY